MLSSIIMLWAADLRFRFSRSLVLEIHHIVPQVYVVEKTVLSSCKLWNERYVYDEGTQSEFAARVHDRQAVHSH